MKRILASASPRRRELIEKLNVPFEVIPAEGEEIVRGEEPPQIVMGLAEQKAEEVAGHILRGQTAAEAKERTPIFILGADTVVSRGGQILGKPQDAADAARMLHLLSGAVHQVYTGVCMIYETDGKFRKYSFCEQTDVEFYPVSDAEIAAYVKSGEPMDKAGAYGIQGAAALYVKCIRGDYYNVVGLPIARVYQEMKEQFPDVL